MYKMTLNDVMAMSGGMFLEEEPEKIECDRCYRELYKDDDEHYVAFSNGDIICNDCLRDYCKEMYT